MSCGSGKHNNWPSLTPGGLGSGRRHRASFHQKWLRRGPTTTDRCFGTLEISKNNPWCWDIYLHLGHWDKCWWIYNTWSIWAYHNFAGNLFGQEVPEVLWTAVYQHICVCDCACDRKCGICCISQISESAADQINHVSDMCRNIKQ